MGLNKGNVEKTSFIINLIVYMFSAINILGCAWIYIGKIVKCSWIDEGGCGEGLLVDVEKNFNVYVTSLYWVITTLTTVGYGDYKGYTSEEYLFYVDTVFNDAFGFFISGPGFAGPYAAPPAFPGGAENLAIVPGTTDPITISTIHPGMNAQYYVDSPNDPTQSFNGHTVPMSIAFSVQCDSLYHFKFAIADCQDETFDSGIFLEAGSFSTNLIELETMSNFSGSFTDTLLAEGCTSTTLIFIRPTDTIADTISLVIGGDIDPTLDLTGFTDSIIFPIGVDTVSLVINPVVDGLTEPMEYIEIGFYNVTVCGDSIYDSLLLYVVDNYPMTWDLPDTLLTYCIQNVDQVEVTNFDFSIPPFGVDWSFNSTDNPVDLPLHTINADTTTYYVTLTDGCNQSFYDSVTYISNQTLVIDSLQAFNASTCDPPDGLVVAYPSGETEVLGIAFNHWVNADSSAFYNASVWDTGIPAGWYYFSIQDDVCTVFDSIEVQLDEAPIADFSFTPPGGCAPLDVVFTNNSSDITVLYEWHFGNGDPVLTVGNMGDQSATYTSTAQVTLVAYDASMCPASKTLTIPVEPCGCTDPDAENYDPTATIDDGSCFYPLPVVVAPNVFTPNGDGDNDLFQLDAQNAVSIELTIVNRWGNVISISEGPNPVWDGTTIGGGIAVEGTYFYKYVATGSGGETVDDHGFVQLIMD